MGEYNDRYSESSDEVRKNSLRRDFRVERLNLLQLLALRCNPLTEPHVREAVNLRLKYLKVLGQEKDIEPRRRG